MYKNLLQQWKQSGWYRYQKEGSPIHVRGWHIQPIVQVTQVRWPGGAWVWHRPLAINIQQGNTITQIRISDTTLRIVAALCAAGLAVIVGTKAAQYIRER